MPSFKRERCGKRIQPAEDKVLMVAGGKQREDVSVYVWDILYAKCYFLWRAKCSRALQIIWQLRFLFSSQTATTNFAITSYLRETNCLWWFFWSLCNSVLLVNWIKPCLSNVSMLYSLKTPENQNENTG